MKKLFNSLLSFIRPVKSSVREGYLPVHVDDSSQPYALASHMERTQVPQQKGSPFMSHGTTVLADIEHVRVVMEGLGKDAKAIIRFCPMEKISVKKLIESGDGNPLPALNIKLYGIGISKDIPSSARYILKDVIISSNGTLQVKATEKTRWVKITS